MKAKLKTGIRAIILGPAKSFTAWVTGQPPPPRPLPQIPTSLAVLYIPLYTVIHVATIIVSL